MLGGGSITLFHIRGIRIAVDWSWFVILFLVIFWMSNFYDELLGSSAGSTTPFILAGVLVVQLQPLVRAWLKQR